MNIDQAVEALVEKLNTWLAELIALLPNLIIAVLLLIAAVFAARLAQRGVKRVMERVSPYAHVNNLMATVARVAVLVAGLFAALTVVELDEVVVTLLAGVGVIGLALGFAFQDIAANFISGLLLAVRRPFREGDLLETNEHLGQVEEINLRTTILDTFQGQRVIIPNQEVLGNPMINYSQLGRRRIDLSCGVAYGDDLERAKAVALETVRGIEYRDESRTVDLYYNEFGGSSVNFVICFWVEFTKQSDFLRAQSDSIVRLKNAFDEAGITIPFPICTLDFGVVGGEKLNEMLPPSMYRDDAGATGGASAPDSPAPDASASEASSGATASGRDRPERI